MRKWAGVAAASVTVIAVIGAVQLGGVERANAAGLERFESCDQLLGYLRQESQKVFESYGSGGIAGGIAQRENLAEAGRALEGDDSAAPSAADMKASKTNVQEAGIDEPDIVKNDGKRIFAVSNGTLYVVDVTGDKPVVTGKVQIGADTGQDIYGDSLQLMISGDDVVLLGGAWNASTQRYGTHAVFVKVASGTPEVRERFFIGSDYVNARQLGNTLRLVVRTSLPNQPLEDPQRGIPENPDKGGTSDGGVVPAPGPTEETESEVGSTGSGEGSVDPGRGLEVEPDSGAIAPDSMPPETNEPDSMPPDTIEPIEPDVTMPDVTTPGVTTPDVTTPDVTQPNPYKDATIDQWLPTVHRVDAEGKILDTKALSKCEDVYRPNKFAGLGLTTVVTFDMATPELGEPISVLADGNTLYASSASLYIATNRWSADVMPMGLAIDEIGPDAPIMTGDATSTEIHKFDINGTDEAAYVASGGVEGRILNQWSFSEHEGKLRVATTLGATGERDSESQVVVLEQQGGELKQIGSVGGLGKAEEIYAVRYFGDTAYVVTFETMRGDPLYALDLSNPKAPKLLGELKIPGFSSYLHPVGDGLLLGVGRETGEGASTEGFKLSLFDVSDPAKPVEVDKWIQQDGWSPAADDHHAFLYWADRNLVALPISWTEYSTPAPRPEPLPEPMCIEEEGAVKCEDVIYSDPYVESVSHNEVALFSISEKAIEKSGAVRLDGEQLNARSLVIGDTLYVVNGGELIATALDGLTETSRTKLQ